jgi:NAD(P)-dependent dehydrogenase (short-subunit alcohol dehydrogenase family)
VDCVAAEAQKVGEAEMSRVLLGRVAAPAELAAAIVHLALDATYSTGSVVTVAGRLQRPLVAQS